MRSDTKAAFEQMKKDEMALDDMDYLTDSPKIKKAMASAEQFRTLLERDDNAEKCKAQRRWVENL